MATTPSRVLLLCEHPDKTHPTEACGYGVSVCKGGELPLTCPRCSHRGRWRVALPGEYSRPDRDLLRAYRIAC